MNYSFNHIFFIIVILVFGVYESAEMVSMIMFKMGLGEDKTSLFLRLALLLLCGGYFLFFYSKPKRYFSGALGLLMLYVWGVSMMNMEQTANFMAYIMRTATILGPLFAFYYFYNVGQVIKDKIFFIGIISAIILFGLGFARTYEIQLMYSQTGDTRFSALYIFLFLLPLFMSSPNSLLRIGGMVFVAVCMIFSLKRGGFISFALALVVYYLVNTYCSKGKVKINKIWWAVFSLILISVIVMTFLENYVDALFERLTSVSEDEGSNRLAVYEVTWKMIINSDLISFIFGHGWDVLKKQSPLELSAHNDFLEVLYDCGLIALILYLYLVFCLYKTLFKLIHNRSEYAAPFAFSVISFTINSTIAHILIYPNNLFAMTLVWGYLLGKENVSKKTKKYKKLNENRNFSLSFSM